MVNKIFNYFSGSTPADKKNSSDSIDEDSREYQNLTWYEKFAVSLAKRKTSSVKSHALIRLATHLEQSDNIEDLLQPQIQNILHFLKKLDLGPKVLGLMVNSPEKVEAFLNDIAISLIANIADEVVEESKTVTMEELADRTSWFLIKLVGENFNAIDAQVIDGHPVNDVLFRPFVDRLMEICLRNSGMIGSIVKKAGLEGVLVGKLREAYGDYEKKMRGEKVAEQEVPDLKDLNPLFNDASKFLLNALVQGTGKRDLECIVKLTGEPEETVQKSLQFLSGKVAGLLPELLPDLLKGNGKEAQISQLLVNQLVSNFIRNRYAKQIEDGTSVPLSEVFEEVSNYLVIEVSGHAKHQRMEELPLKLLKMMLPPDLPFVLDFLERRRDPLLKTVDEVCQSFATKLNEDPEALEEEWERELDALEGDKDALKAKVKSLSDDSLKKGLEEVKKLFDDVPDALKGVKGVLENQWVIAQLDCTLRKSFMTVLLNLVKMAKENGATKTEEVIPKILEQLLQFGENSLTDTLRMYRGRNVENPQAWLEARLKPVTAQFLDRFLSKDLIDAWPIPIQFKEQFQTFLQGKLNGFAVPLFIAFADQAAVDDTAELKAEIKGSLEGLENQEAFLKKVEEWEKSAVSGALGFLPVKNSEALNAQVSLTTRRIFYRSILKIVTLPHEGEITSCDQLIPRFVQKVLNENSRELPRIFEEFKEFGEGKTEKERLEWAGNALKAVTAQVYGNLIPENILDLFPVPAEIKGPIEKALLGQLNQVFAQIFIAQVENMGREGPEQLSKVIEQELTFPDKDSHALLKQLDDLVKLATDAGHRAVEDIVRGTHAEQWILDQVDTAIQKGLLLVVLQWIRKAKEQGADSPEAIIPKILRNLINVLDGHSRELQGIFEGYIEFGEGKTEKERLEWAEKALKDVTAQVYGYLVPENILDQLPVPVEAKKNIENALLAKLNQVLAQFFMAQVENMGREGPEQVREVIEHELTFPDKDAKPLLHQIDALVKEARSAGRKAIVGVVKGIDSEQWVLTQSERAIQKSLLLVVLQLIRKAKDQGADSPEAIIPKILEKLVRTGGDLDQLTAELVSVDIFQALPIPDSFKEQVHGIVRDQVKGLLLELFTAYNLHKEKEENDLTQLRASIGDLIKHPQEENPYFLKLIDAFSGFVEEVALEGIKNVIPFAPEASSQENQWLIKQYKEAIRSLLYKIILKMLQDWNQDGVLRNEMVLPFLYDQLMEFCSIHLPTFYDGYCNEMAISESPKHMKRWVEKNLKPITEQFLQQFVEVDLKTLLPLPEKLQDVVYSSINGFFAKVFIACTDSMANEAHSEQKLKVLFNNEEEIDALPAVKLCHMAGKFAEEGIPFAFRENGEEWAKTLTSDLLYALEFSTDAHGERTIKTMLLTLFKHLGTGENQPMMQFLGRLIESLLMKFMGGLAENVSKMEVRNHDSESLLEQAVLLIATEAKEHFKILAENRSLLKRTNLEDLKEAFREREHLHPGMDSVEEASNPVFQTWVMKLAILMGMNANELPLPEFLQAKVWSRLQDQLLPMLLKLIFDSVKDPNTLRVGLIALLESFDAEFDAKKNRLQSLKKAFIPDTDPEEFAQEVELKLFVDEYQEKLKAELGEAAYHFIRMHPSLLAGLMLRFKKIQTLVGQTVGQTLREEVRDIDDNAALPFVEFMNNGFKVIVESLMPCERNEEGEWSYYAMDRNGARTGDPLEAPSLKNLYPNGPFEKIEAEMQVRVQSRRNLNRIMKGLPKVIQKEADLLLQRVLNTPYDKFARFCVKAARKIGGRRFGELFAKGMKKFLWFVRRYVVAPFLLAITLPVWLPIRAIIHLVLKKQGRSRVEDLDNEIMGNLFFRLFEKMFEKFSEQMVEENPA